MVAENGLGVTCMEGVGPSQRLCPTDLQQYPWPSSGQLQGHYILQPSLCTRAFHLTGILLRKSNNTPSNSHTYVRMYVSMEVCTYVCMPHRTSPLLILKDKSQPHPYDLCRDIPISTTLSSAVGEEDKSHLVQWVVLALVVGVDGSPHCAGQPPVVHLSHDQLGASLVLSRSVWAGQKGSGRGRKVSQVMMDLPA